MSYLTSFTTTWGNALLGMWVTWKPSGYTAPSGAVTATTKMLMDFDIKLYTVGWKGIETGGSDNGSPDFTANPTVQFYVLWQNPLDLVGYTALATDAKVPYNDWVAYDGVVN